MSSVRGCGPAECMDQHRLDNQKKHMLVRNQKSAPLTRRARRSRALFSIAPPPSGGPSARAKIENRHQEHIFCLHMQRRVWSLKRSFFNCNFNKIGERNFSEHVFFWYGDQRIHGACVVRATRLARLTRLTRLGRLADHKPQMLHLTRWSHSISCKAALHSVAQTKFN